MRLRKNFLFFLENFAEQLPAIKTSVATEIKNGLLSGWQKIRNTNLFGRRFGKKVWMVVVIALLVLLLVVGGQKLYQALRLRSMSSGSTPQMKGPLATQDINKEFSFPLKNTKGEEVTTFKYIVEKAELRDEIIVKGQKATAVKGRVFLIINLKINNDYIQTIVINTKDFIRLSVNGNENELLAPDIHNDPVEAQAISTKYTRLGFPINDSDESLVLWVGEINGDKQKIDLKFH
ncbi:MAG: hypothetical protein A2Z35_03420 [Actinobacteria bacterium RBG_19FT_COMBO_36_27]|nr:MAG: hypothetical protein A2Z35_03420 [Actinobacteria bacterium RBG_19FT_COMBO_36_27]